MSEGEGESARVLCCVVDEQTAAEGQNGGEILSLLLYRYIVVVRKVTSWAGPSVVYRKNKLL